MSITKADITDRAELTGLHLFFLSRCFCYGAIHQVVDAVDLQLGTIIGKVLLQPLLAKHLINLLRSYTVKRPTLIS